MRFATFSITALLLVLLCDVRTAQADISIELIEVTADSGTFESAYVADIPAGFTSWQFSITTDTWWIGSELHVVLEQGSIFYGPFTGNPISPNVALFGFYPSARFGSHLSGTNVDPTDGQRQSTNFPPNPVLPRKDKTYTDREIATVWYTADPLLETSGTHVIGMLTLSNDAMGTFRMSAFAPDSVVDLSTREMLLEPNPFILNSQIFDGQLILSDVSSGFARQPLDAEDPGPSDGEFVAWADALDSETAGVPEPSTALLAILGLMGLVCRYRTPHASIKPRPLVAPGAFGDVESK